MLREARQSASPYTYTAVVIALHTGMRNAEIGHLQWRQIDFFKRILTVGKSKTPEGTGRTVPLNSELLKTLLEHQTWFEVNIGSPRGDHFVFAGRSRRKIGVAQRYDAARPVTSFRTGWTRVRRLAQVSGRYHDLRHTLVTKLRETGAGDETIGPLLATFPSA
jgi:integrase